MRIAISIVSFNTKDYLETLLKKISEQKGNLIEVWVWDNNSQDGSPEMIKQKFPKVNLVESKINLGFAKGHNLILKKTLQLPKKDNYDFLVLLNPDVELNDQAIDQMVDFMEKHPDCAVSSCQILDFDGHLQSNGGDLPFGMALVAWLFNLEFLGNLANFHRGENRYYSFSHQVGWVGGTFMIIRAQILKKIGLFNEDYFMYFEDVEFCYKVWQAGYQVMINPAVVIRHKGGASSPNPRLAQWRGEFRGLLYFYQKQFGFLAAFIIRLLLYVSIIFRIIIFALIGKANFSKTYGQILFNI